MVICKNKNDSIRMHNLMEKWCIDKKMKYVAFMGDLRNSQYKSDWIKRIQDLTHWSWTKIGRLSTRD